MNGKCFYVLYYGHVILNEWEMLLCALLWACNTEWMGFINVKLNEWEMLFCALLWACFIMALLWACNTEWMGNAFMCFIMGM